MHYPVLLQPVLKGLNIKSGGKYIDATFGEGGYSQTISDCGGRVLAIDWDKDQLSKVNDKRLVLVQGNFKNIEIVAKEKGFYPVDGIVFDLGLSMNQLNESGKGLSFKKIHEPLDMRLDQSEEETAADLVNGLNVNGLYDLFASYSEELKSKIIANRIVEMRTKKRIKKVADLLTIIDKALGEKDKAVYRRIFQALRIAVNHEFTNLQAGLVGALHLIKNDGRIVVVTFHSLEDRIVKRFVRENGLIFDSDLIKGDRNISYEKSAKLRIIKNV